MLIGSTVTAGAGSMLIGSIDTAGAGSTLIGSTVTAGAGSMLIGSTGVLSTVGDVAVGVISLFFDFLPFSPFDPKINTSSAININTTPPVINNPGNLKNQSKLIISPFIPLLLLYINNIKKKF